jgi:cytochrome c oxidase subunit 2
MCLLNFMIFKFISFQNPATPISEGIIDLHHSIFFFLLLILIPILWIFKTIILNNAHQWTYPNGLHIVKFQKNYLILNKLTHGTLIEIVWTIMPALILMFIALPSFSLLYSLDEIIDQRQLLRLLGSNGSGLMKHQITISMIRICYL